MPKEGPARKACCDEVTPMPANVLLRQPTYLLFEMVRLARRTSRELFPGEHLRLPQAAVLACLADQGPMSQREVSDALRLDPGDLVGVIDKLETLNYVLRRRDAGDRRRHALELTAQGRAALRERHDRDVRVNDTLLSTLDPAERDQLRSLLLRVLGDHDPRFAGIRQDAPEAGMPEADAPAPSEAAPDRVR
jgi:DNA-binding MarR family transcriptional regulator